MSNGSDSLGIPKGSCRDSMGRGDPQEESFGMVSCTNAAGRLLIRQIYGTCADVCRAAADTKLLAQRTSSPRAVRLITAPSWLAASVATLLAAFANRDDLLGVDETGYLDACSSSYRTGRVDVGQSADCPAGSLNGLRAGHRDERDYLQLPMSGGVDGSAPVVGTLALRRVAQHGPPRDRPSAARRYGPSSILAWRRSGMTC